VEQGGQQPKQLEQVQKLRIQVLLLFACTLRARVSSPFCNRERQDFSEEAEKSFQQASPVAQQLPPLSPHAYTWQARQSWLKATSSEDLKEWYRCSSRAGANVCCRCMLTLVQPARRRGQGHVGVLPSCRGARAVGADEVSTGDKVLCAQTVVVILCALLCAVAVVVILCAPHQQRLNTEMLRLKEIKEKQLKSLRVRCS
jgi:hypothetical protein